MRRRFIRLKPLLLLFRVLRTTIHDSLRRPRKLFQATLTRLRGRSRSYFSIWRHFGAAKARPEATLSHPMGEGRGEGVFPFSSLRPPCSILVAATPRCVFRGWRQLPLQGPSNPAVNLRAVRPRALPFDQSLVRYYGRFSK